jgi:lysophospholipase L1-like esterase
MNNMRARTFSSGPAGYALYLVLTAMVIVCVVEGMALLVERSRGRVLPFLYSPRTSESTQLRTLEGAPLFLALDPILGYAHRDNEPMSKPIQTPHEIIPGFVRYGLHTYNKRIVVLGGSTTDPFLYGHSWPEELAKLLQAENFEVSVFNGGVGGYSSSQELLKLIRDVFELKPFLVIVYDGLNDLDNWSPTPWPMVHSYQRNIFNYVAQSSGREFPILPNSLTLLQRIMTGRGNPPQPDTVSFGIPTELSAGEYLTRNMEFMYALTQSRHVHFRGFLQPVVGFGNYQMNDMDKERLEKRGPDYLAALQQTYEIATKETRKRDYWIDLTNIFANHQDVFRSDGRHLTQKGNYIIATAILEKIRPILTTN